MVMKVDRAFPRISRGSRRASCNREPNCSASKNLIIARAGGFHQDYVSHEGSRYLDTIRGLTKFNSDLHMKESQQTTTAIKNGRGTIGGDDSTTAATTPTATPKKSIRYLEARRVSTCRFADRVAALSVSYYQNCVPEVFRREPTCLATIVAVIAPIGNQAHEILDNYNAITEKDNEDTIGANECALSDRMNSEKSLGNEKCIPDRMTVLAMGVGTKFLTENMLTTELASVSSNDPQCSIDVLDDVPLPQKRQELCYGERVRDCHAEVLARRAFRRYLTNEIIQDLDVNQKDRQQLDRTSSCLLQRVSKASVSPKGIYYQLKPGVTLHFYCSSSPCGNSVLKKFATFETPVFQSDLGETEWPRSRHDPIPPHSIALGQFALLVKRDSHSNKDSLPSTCSHRRRPLTSKQQYWPIYCQTDWCPPGTAPVWAGQGSLHTCSDKIARWNYLGYQGSLLSCLFNNEPLYMTSFTVGRKFSGTTCCRAFCCRLETKQKRNSSLTPSSKKPKISQHLQQMQHAKHNATTGREKVENKQKDNEQIHHANKYNTENDTFSLHHPAIMGTSVYMDASGVVELSANADSTQDVRFHSSRSWVAWKSHERNCDNDNVLECLDGSTGWTLGIECLNQSPDRSEVSTWALTESFLKIDAQISHQSMDDKRPVSVPTTLHDLRDLKLTQSPEYEDTKTHLFNSHPVLRDWCRRAEI